MASKTLFKLDGRYAMRQWTIWTEDDMVWIEHGLQDGEKVTDNYTALPKNIGRSNETTGAQQAKLEMKSRYDKQLRLGYHKTEDKAHSASTDFKPMKLTQGLELDDNNESMFNKAFDQLPDMVEVQRKYDGVWCDVTNGPNGLVFHSRGNTIFTCMDNNKRLFEVDKDMFMRSTTTHTMQDDIRQVFAANNILLDNMAHIEKAGEEWEVIDFQYIDADAEGKTGSVHVPMRYRVVSRPGRSSTTMDVYHKINVVDELAFRIPEGCHLIGEMDNDNFRETTIGGALKAHNPGIIVHSLKFIIHDVYYEDNDELNAQQYSRRMNIIKSLVWNCKNVEVVTSLTLPKAKVMDALNAVRDLGQEGLVVRNINCVYECGKRSKQVIKIVPFSTTDHEILDIYLSNKGQVMFKFAEFNATWNATHDEQLKAYDNRVEHIGKMASIKYRDFTSGGKPKFPKVAEFYNADIKDY